MDFSFKSVDWGSRTDPLPIPHPQLLPITTTMTPLHSMGTLIPRQKAKQHGGVEEQSGNDHNDQDDPSFTALCSADQLGPIGWGFWGTGVRMTEEDMRALSRTWSLLDLGLGFWWGEIQS